MNTEFLKRMSESELDEYASALGLSAKGAPDAAAKIRLIEGRRERAVTVRALGIDFEIPVKRGHDQRVADALSVAKDDETMAAAMELLLGAEQFAILIEACTDADGTVDVEAMGLAFVKVATSPELKNF